MSIYYLHKPLAYLMCAVILVKAKMIACRLSLFIIFLCYALSAMSASPMLLYTERSL